MSGRRDTQSAPSLTLPRSWLNKDELVAALRQEKYADLVDAYGFDFITIADITETFHPYLTMAKG